MGTRMAPQFANLYMAQFEEAAGNETENCDVMLDCSIKPNPDVT